MAQVVVSVQNCGLTVVEQAVDLEREAWIGDVRGARVRYAGPPVHLRVVGDRVLVGNVQVATGQPRVVQERPVRVTVELVATHGFHAELPRFDARILVASAALVLLAWWLDSVGSLVTDPPAEHASQPLVGGNAPRSTIHR